MRKIIAILASLEVTTALWAVDFEVNGIAYNILGNDSVEVISKNPKYIGDISIPSTIEYNSSIYRVTNIGYQAFRSCAHLTSITIPNSVTNIGDMAFCSCSSLSTVHLGNNVSRIGSYAFYECISLTSFTIPKSVTKIEGFAFSGCTGIISLTIPNNVISIWNDAFCYVNNVVYSGIAPGSPWGAKCVNGYIDGLMVYSDSAKTNIAGCSSAATGDITIPNIVKSIEKDAFYACTSISSFSCYATTPPLCEKYSFSTISKLIPIYVFYECNVESYQKAEVWNAFSNIIGIPQYNIIIDTANNGNVSMNGFRCEGEEITLAATAQYGYRFIQWSDGNTTNPRSFIISQDTTFKAIFEKDTFTITTEVNDPERGKALGDTTAAYLDTIIISATANYGYQFAYWSDWNYDNPRKLVVTKDQTLTAHFDKKYFYINKINNEGGTIIGNSYDQYLNNVTLTAKPNNGYQFTQWSDGDTTNPRTFTITKDTTFEALFSKNYSGKCGDQLIWKYQEEKLIVSGTGDMYNYQLGTSPWNNFKDSITSVVIENNATSIGNYAFYNCANKNFKRLDLPNTIQKIGGNAFEECTYLKSVTIGPNIENVGTKAFGGDLKIIYVTCYAIEPPTLAKDAFCNWDAYLNVPCEAVAEYKVSEGWKLFNKENISCIGAEEATTTTVVVTPGDNYVTITWPSSDNAQTYAIDIKKDGIKVCTLTFNNLGQLTNISMAPGRGSNNNVEAVEVAGGFKFTITSLNQGTTYNYEINTKNISGSSIANYTGTFTTTGTSTKIEAPNSTNKPIKILKDGQLLISRMGKIYTATGIVL